MFKSIMSLKPFWDSDYDDIAKDFYNPVFSSAKSYRAVVAYFDSSFFFHTVDGIMKFIENNGKLEYILCTTISAKDYDAILNGYGDTQNVEEQILENYKTYLEKIREKLNQENREATSLLIQSKHLDIKIGVRPNSSGIVHHKIMSICDHENNRITVNGSSNSTGAAIISNADSFRVDRSWKSDYELKAVIHYEKTIDRFFKDQSVGTKVLSFSEASKKKYIKITTNTLGTGGGLGTRKPPKPKIPKIPETFNGNKFILGKHQKAALTKWVESNSQSILAMATGSGKTVTAAVAIVKIFEQLKEYNLPLFVIIIVPQNTLGNQWIEELKTFNIDSVKCFDDSKVWKGELGNLVNQFGINLENKKSTFTCILTNNATYTGKIFKDIVRSLYMDGVFVIGDECHNHNTELRVESLPKAMFRLGLSATPEHDWNGEANKRLYSFYKKISYEYPIKEAIDDKILTPYKYYVLKVEPTEKELDELTDIQKKISRTYAMIINNKKNANLQMELNRLYGNRNLILGTLENKIRVLNSHLNETTAENFTLFYVSGDSDKSSPMIQKTQKTLSEHKWKTSKFTGSEDDKERKSILKNFKDGVVNGMVAIKCLDEGIDVPACKTAYLLASAKESRQFIQRRGRVLRQAPNIGKTEAYIYDFVVVIPKTSITQTFGKDIQKAEFARVYEFRRYSNNENESKDKLMDIAKIWGLENFL